MIFAKWHSILKFPERLLNCEMYMIDDCCRAMSVLIFKLTVHNNLYNHGLYYRTSCCQWERAILDPPAPRPLDRFSWILKYITTSRILPSMQNFRGLCQRGWSGQIASLTHESFCPFWFLRPAHGSHLWHTPMRNTSLYVVLAKVVPFWGYEDEIWNLTLFPPKKT